MILVGEKHVNLHIFFTLPDRAGPISNVLANARNWTYSGLRPRSSPMDRAFNGSSRVPQVSSTHLMCRVWNEQEDSDKREKGGWEKNFKPS